MLDFADGKVRLVATRANRDGALVGHPLRDLSKHIPNVECRVVAIYRGGRGILPDGDTVVQEADEVFFIAARKDTRTVLREMRKLDSPVRKVVIAGGGNIGLDLARAIEGSCQVKIIERDWQRARRISDELARAVVLHGDSADEELLLEENIDSADVFVAVTNAEEANILSAMLAKRLGARKVMALINKPAYAELVESGTIDIAISPQQITLGSLLAHVRRGDVVKVHSLAARRRRGDRSRGARGVARVTRRRPSARRDPAAARRDHQRHRSRRRGADGAPRHADPSRRPCDSVHRRPPADRRGGTAVRGRRRVRLVSAEAQRPAAAAGVSALRGSMSLLPVLFALSGCAALIYQVVWFEQLGLSLGTSAISLGVLLAAFMGGMGLGSVWLARSVSGALPALRVYAALELGIGALGVAALVLIPLAGNAYTAWAGNGSASLLLRALAAAICLLPATVLMGATLPVVAGAVAGERDAGQRLGFCYAANIGGGVLGSLGAAFYLLRVHDVYVATAVAATLNLVGAALAWYAAARPPWRSVGPAVELEPAARARGAIYWATGASGFTALSSEVLWTRHLSLLFGATVYAFALILAVFLLGLGVGSAGGAMLGRRLDPRRALAGCQLALAVALAWAAYIIARSLPFWPLDVTLPTTASTMLQLDWLRTAWAVLPAALLWGASFPLALAACATPAALSRATVGRLYSLNTAGALAGALLTALVLIDTVGSRRIEQGSVLVAGGVGLWLLLGPGMRRQAPALAAGIAAAAVIAGLAYVLPAVPAKLIAYGRFLPTRGADANVVYWGEGLAASVAVTREPNGLLTYHNAGKTQASTYPQDLRLQKMLGHLATLVADRPASVFVIGLGAGITAGAASVDPAVEQVVVAEIEPLVPQIAARFFSTYNQGVVANPKVEIRIDDGRHYLATTSRRFDVITSDPLDPWVKGAATLYTREFWQLVKARLTAGGVVTAFVQLYETNDAAVRSEIATFLDVFPNGALFANRVDGIGYDAVLLARADGGPIDVERVDRRLRSTAYGRVSDSLAASGFASALDLLGTYAGDAPAMSTWLAGAARNTDRNLRLQYLAGASLNSYRANDILAGLVAAPAPLSERLFVGPAATLEALRQRVGAAPGDD